jgi:hypothetical protein
VANETKELKVTDKRMFTPEGELREEYRVLLEKSTSPAAPPSSPSPLDAQEPPAASRRPEPPAEPREAPRRGAEADSSARLDFPSPPPGMGPTFFDLAAMLAEPVAIYLGDLELPDGQSAVNLEMASLHIDMLDVLRQKTLGNLTAQESAFLEDLLYRLRVRYVQKRG